MKDFEFYQNLELKYPEFAICIEDSEPESGLAKFYIPVLTPMLESEESYDEEDLNVSTSNIINDSSSMELNGCTVSNYLELHLPDSKATCHKGDKFVVVFVGGDPNKPFLLGRYYDAINE